MAIQNNFPAIAPTLNLSFALTKALDPRVSFARASAATYYGTQTAKAEENLLVRSQEFENAAWSNTLTTRSADSVAAPDGTTTADTLTATASTGEHRIFQTVSQSAQVTLSVFLKQNTHDFVQFRTDAADSGFVNFNIALGTLSATTATGTITNVGSGWYRCTATFAAATIASVQIQIISSLAAARSEAWATAGTESIYLWGAQLEQRSAVTAYTPTTDQPITNYIPVLESAAAGVARFDHNPTTFESLGLLIEEQRTNLVTYSEQFDNAAWTKTRASITANTVVSPDGTLDADKLVENTDNNTHLILQSVSGTTNTNAHTVTVYAKAAERSFLNVQVQEGSPFSRQTVVAFNLSAGTAGAPNDSGGASGTSAQITSVGNGWYRCSVTTTLGGTAGAIRTILLTNNGSTSSYTGNGYSGIYIWGAQLEAGAFPTSYIPTVASQVTRAIDAASMTGADFSSWYRQDEGAFYSEARKPSALASAIVWSANDNSFNNRQSFVYVGTGSLRYRSITNNVADGAISFSVSADDYVKAAGAYKVNDFAFSTSGAAAGTDTSVLVPVISQLNIGTEFGAIAAINGHIRKLAYYPKRLTNAELQGLTS